MYLHPALGWFEMSDLDTLVEEMSAISVKWESMGKELGIEQHYLTDIFTTYNSSHECLWEMLRGWLEGNFADIYYFPGWGDIIGALENMGESQLANHLKVKYIPGGLTITILTTKWELGVDCMEIQPGFKTCIFWLATEAHGIVEEDTCHLSIDTV